MELSRGHRIGEYELLDEIGRGGMAQVWSVRDIRSGHVYAVKTLLPEYASDAALQERLLREARNQCQLQHASIVRAYGTFQSEGQTFILMELVHGESLESYLTRRHPLPLAEVKGIARAVFGGLSYAHSRRLVHRDLKPSNILLSKSGAIQIADFGIALVMGQVRLTKFGAMGTPAYMSPEQIRTPMSIDHRSDIYSFACVLYELVSGYPPFHFETGENDYLVREAHLNRRPQPPSRLNPETPPAFDRAILMALEKDPAARFQSCEEFAAALGVQMETGGVQQPGPAPRVVVAPSLRSTPGAPGTPASATPHRVITPRPATPAGATPQRVITPHPASPRPPLTPRTPPSKSPPRPMTPAAGMQGQGAGGTGGMGGGSAAAPAMARIPSAPTPVSLPGSPSPLWKRPRFLAIGGAALLLLLAFAVFSRHSSAPSAPLPKQAVDTAPQPAAEALQPEGEPMKRQQPATEKSSSEQGQAEPAQATPAPVVMPTLRRYLENQTSEPAAGDAPSVGKRPQGLGPRSAANSAAPRSTPGPSADIGVLRWDGVAPVGGGTITIDAGQTGGALTGDPLPGVPVQVAVDAEGVYIAGAPGQADGYRRLVLRVPPNVKKPIRITWQVRGEQR